MLEQASAAEAESEEAHQKANTEHTEAVELMQEALRKWGGKAGGEPPTGAGAAPTIATAASGIVSPPADEAPELQ